MTPDAARGRSRFLAVICFLGIAGCASSKPAPKPAANPDARALVVSLTGLLKLDAAQQEQTLQFAQELIERNGKIVAAWDRGERVRPQALLESRAIFERELRSILTEEQQRAYGQAMIRVLTKGRRFGTS